MFSRQYHNLNVIEISSQKLIQNYHNLEKKYHAQIAPVLKSNAYGCDIILVAKILEKENPPFFCVDSLYEAYQLQKSGIKTKILIMGYTAPENLRHKKLPFSFAVSTLDTLKTLQIYQPQAPIHIFVDTGMHREGFLLKDLPKDLKVQGLMTHLATYKNKTQLENFKKAQKIISAKYIHPGNVWRIGLELYKDVLTFKATIVQIKNIEKGDKVGYDFTFKAPHKMKIGIVSAGYNDGVDHKLSNIYPFVGRISMNMCTLNMAKFPGAKVGDKIVLPIQNKLLFPYETLVHLNQTTKRVII